VLLANYGRYGCEYLQPSKPCLATATTTTTKISSSFSPARTATQRPEASRGGSQIILSGTIHIHSMIEFLASRAHRIRYYSNSVSPSTLDIGQHASKSRDGQAIPPDSIVSLMARSSRIPKDTDAESPYPKQKETARCCRIEGLSV
jgi:hypothetical protein